MCFWLRWADVGGRRVELTAILYSEASDLLLVSSLLINQIVYSPNSKFANSNGTMTLNDL